MNTQTISLEEITKKASELRQRVRDEVNPAHNREVGEYRRNYEKPFWPFGKKRRKYEQELETINESYQNHPLIQEWTALQEQCSHKYSKWEEIDGPSEQRECSVCYHKQHRLNFDFGGFGIA